MDQVSNPVTVTVPAQSHAQQGSSPAQVGHFVLHFLEMQIPMALGALVCYLLVRLLPASSRFATIYHPGTRLYYLGDTLFLTVPVVAWMIFRGHGWRHSLAMAVAMLTPVAVIIVLGQLAGYAVLPWLPIAGYPAQSLGMLVYMLYHRAEYMKGRMGPTAHPWPGAGLSLGPRASSARRWRSDGAARDSRRCATPGLLDPTHI
jgi:hypothetical protein